MNQLDLLNELKNSLGELTFQIDAAAAMQLYDINKVAENLVLGLMREIVGLHHLRNLNADEKANFPGIDLADDHARVAIQVTATSTLEKVKSTIDMFLSHGLQNKYDRLIIYILTRRQGSYSQDAIDKIAQGKIAFQTSRDIWDFRDLASAAISIQPSRLQAAIEVLRAYLRGVPTGLAPVDFDPPSAPPDTATLNFLEVYFPSTLYIADLRTEVGPEKKTARVKNERKLVREYSMQLGRRVPSDYEVNARKIITFHPLDDINGPFSSFVDPGTITPLSPRDFYEIDSDHERIFKSLLRFCMQQKLYKHAIEWRHEDGLFIFMPRHRDDTSRDETWMGQRQSTRRVFEKKRNKNDPSKFLHGKHFAFGVDFVMAEDGWYVALTPDWFFSYGDEFRRSGFADDAVSWLKRRESNRIVFDHFRFIKSWLGNLDQEDLFSTTDNTVPTLTFGETVTFSNYPRLFDDNWLPIRDALEDDEDSPIAKLFGAA